MLDGDTLFTTMFVTKQSNNPILFIRYTEQDSFNSRLTIYTYNLFILYINSLLILYTIQLHIEELMFFIKLDFRL